MVSIQQIVFNYNKLNTVEAEHVEAKHVRLHGKRSTTIQLLKYLVLVLKLHYSFDITQTLAYSTSLVEVTPGLRNLQKAAGISAWTMGQCSTLCPRPIQLYYKTAKSFTKHQDFVLYCFVTIIIIFFTGSFSRHGTLMTSCGQRWKKVEKGAFVVSDVPFFNGFMYKPFFFC